MIDSGSNGGLDIGRETPDQVKNMTRYFPGSLKRPDYMVAIRVHLILFITMYHQLYKIDKEILNIKVINTFHSRHGWSTRQNN